MATTPEKKKRPLDRLEWAGMLWIVGAGLTVAAASMVYAAAGVGLAGVWMIFAAWFTLRGRRHARGA